MKQRNERGSGDEENKKTSGEVVWSKREERGQAEHEDVEHHLLLAGRQLVPGSVLAHSRG